MLSFNQVYNNSKKQIIANNTQIYNKQKEDVVNVLKEMYAINGKISDLSKDKQASLMKKLLEYWSPKSGIKKAGIKLINEHRITLSPNSTNLDVKKYIKIETKKNFNSITEAFNNNKGNLVVESFRSNITKQIKRDLNVNGIKSIICDTISEIYKQDF